MNKLQYLSETPSISEVGTFSKYTIPCLYISLETTESSRAIVKVLFGFDALKKPEEVQKAAEEA